MTGKGFSKIAIDPELAKAAAQRLERRTRAGDDGRRLGAEGRQKQAEANRQTLLAAARNRPHATVAELLRDTGFSRSQYEGWRARDDFRLAFDGIREQARDEYTGGFEQFRWEFLGKRTPPHQRRIVETIETAPPRTAHLILFPPEAGKSTTLVEYIVYRFTKNPAYRVQWWSKDSEEASKRLWLGKQIMTDATSTRGADGTWGKVIGRFGPFYEKGQERNGRPWRSDKIVLARNPGGELDGNWEAKGIRSNTQGTRANLIVIDDPQDKNNLNESPFILGRVRQEAATRLTRDGVLIWLATRVDVNDVYDLMFTLPDDELFLTSVDQIPAITPEGESYCPEMWSLEELDAARKIVGPAAWARCYMMDPLNAGREPFPKEAMERAKRRSLRRGQAVAGMPACLTIDPGLAPSGVAAFLVASFTTEMRMRLVELTEHFDFVGASDFTTEMERLLIAYPSISHVALEDNDFQKILLADERFLELVDRYDLEVFEHTTGRNKNAHDLGITDLGRGYVKGLIDIPWGEAGCSEMFGKLVEQHIKWRPGIPDKVLKQDLVIVTWIAWRIRAALEAKLERKRQAEATVWNVHRPVAWGQMQRRRTA